jgi:predicted kinase
LNALIVRELQECSGAEALHIVRTSRPRAVDNEYFEKFLYRLPPVELPRALVQLGGTNGSGKSTPLRDLYNASTDVEFIYGEDGRIDASWLRDFGCVVLGHYKNHNGGCDGVTGSGGLARVNQIIDTVLSDPRFYDTPVYFEGLLLASHVNMKRISIVAAKHDIHYIVVHCDPPLKTCLERIYERNGGKPINEDSVNGRHASMRRYMPKFKAEKIAYYIRWCTDNYPQEAMLATFLRIMRNATVGIPYDHYCACDSE